ncbi:MAG: hypothetical protein BGO37_08045 [Cellulomonas sp. 73-92]|nr:MAG: hypothetical protein BGO37_08045 [Cellulomonas sp. 73-92]
MGCGEREPEQSGILGFPLARCAVGGWKQPAQSLRVSTARDERLGLLQERVTAGLRHWMRLGLLASQARCQDSSFRRTR